MKNFFIIIFYLSFFLALAVGAGYLVSILSKELLASNEERIELNAASIGINGNDVVLGFNKVKLDDINHVTWETSEEYVAPSGKGSHGYYYILNKITLYNNEGVILDNKSFPAKEFLKNYIDFIRELANAKKDSFIINIINTSANSEHENQIYVDNQLNYALDLIKDDYNIEIIRKTYNIKN